MQVTQSAIVKNETRLYKSSPAHFSKLSLIHCRFGAYMAINSQISLESAGCTKILCKTSRSYREKIEHNKPQFFKRFIIFKNTYIFCYFSTVPHNPYAIIFQDQRPLEKCRKAGRIGCGSPEFVATKRQNEAKATMKSHQKFDCCLFLS